MPVLTILPVITPTRHPLKTPFTLPFQLDPSCVLCLMPFSNDKWWDFSGKGNHGAIIGATWTAKGRLGPALYFDGVDDYVEIAHSDSLNLNALTVEAWMKSTLTGAWFRTVVAKYGYTGVTPSWGLGWMDTNTLGFYIRDTAAVIHKPMAAAGEGLDGEWHHLVGVASADKVQFWMDEILKDEVTRTAGDIRNDRFVSLAYHYNTYVPETIDEVRIYNRALSSAEILALYEQGREIR